MTGGTYRPTVEDIDRALLAMSDDDWRGCRADIVRDVLSTIGPIVNEARGHRAATRPTQPPALYDFGYGPEDYEEARP